jgi:hypothetical protein
MLIFLGITSFTCDAATPTRKHYTSIQYLKNYALSGLICIPHDRKIRVFQNTKPHPLNTSGSIGAHKERGHTMLNSIQSSTTRITTENQPQKTNALLHPDITRASSAALMQASRHISQQHDYTLKTTIKNSAELESTLQALSQIKQQNPSTKVALISGGSVAGYATALKLFKLGFHVLVAEKRPAYTRENSFILKKEAFFSLTSSAPDGSLLQDLMNQNLLDVHHTNLVKQEHAKTPMDIEAKPNSATRFMNWLRPLPSASSSARPRTVQIPQDAPLHRAALGELDLAWPQQRPLAPVPADQWRPNNLHQIGDENLGLCQIKNLEKGLNAYCVKQFKEEHGTTRRIHILQGEIELSPSNPTSPDFSPQFKLPNEAPLSTKLPFDLICIAEGANSAKAETIGQSFALATQPAHVESWYQANYTAPKQGLHGFFGSIVDKNDHKITAVQHMERQNDAMINVSLGVPPEHALDQTAINTAIVHAEHLCNTAGLNIKLTPNNREFETKRIDVIMKRSAQPMVGNVVMIGDAAGSGSPVGALGGSLSLSAYPEAIERLVTHPNFNDPATRHTLQQAYEKDINSIVNIRHNKPSEVMRTLEFYSENTYRTQLHQARLGTGLTNKRQ